MDAHEIWRIFTRYDEILETAWSEYKAATETQKYISYFNDERFPLTRLAENK